jgi:hypothetical protein
MLKQWPPVNKCSNHTNPVQVLHNANSREKKPTPNRQRWLLRVHSPLVFWKRADDKWTSNLISLNVIIVRIFLETVLHENKVITCTCILTKICPSEGSNLNLLIVLNQAQYPFILSVVTFSLLILNRMLYLWKRVGTKLNVWLSLKN